jgi:hypothetical protein
MHTIFLSENPKGRPREDVSIEGKIMELSEIAYGAVEWLGTSGGLL